MTEEQIKEQLSRVFVEAIASRAGCKTFVITPDHGCDLHVTQATWTETPAGGQFIESGNILQIQLKSACERVIEFRDTELVYDLSAKAYNALVHRRQSRRPTPFILILLVLPDDETTWLQVTPEALSLTKRAYWWQPEESDELVPNTASKRIRIPLRNTVGPEFPEWAFNTLFND